MRRHLAPEPGEVRDRGVSEDQPRVTELSGELERVAAEGGNPAPGVDEDRQAALVSDRDEVAHRRQVEGERLGARVELDPPGARVERALGFRNRGVVRVDAAVGDQDTFGVRGGRDDEVVRLPVSVRLLHREHRGPRVDRRERGEQFRGLLAITVGVVPTDMGVGVEERQRPVGRLERLPPRAGDRVQRVDLGCVYAHYAADGIGPAPRPAAAHTNSLLPDFKYYLLGGTHKVN